MNRKYKGIGWRAVAGLLCLIGMLTACKDDFGENGPQSGALIVKVAAPEGWTSGVAVDESSPDSRCVSVDVASTESSIPLYLHTIESDNPVVVPSTRGALKTTVENFSLSAICYPGSYPENENEVPWKPNFAYNLICTVSGNTASCPEHLLWPTNGHVRFFAFAPVNSNSKDAPFTLSDADVVGSPKITYTVPDDIEKQHDLMAACTDATSAEVNLQFRHILTAVKIVTAEDMIPGKITEVTLSGIPRTGTYTPKPTTGGTWSIDTGNTAKKTYTVEPNIDINNNNPNSSDYTGPDDNNHLHGQNNGKEVIGKTDDLLTLLMIPQTLPAGAKLEIKFTEALSGQTYTLSASLEGKTWPAGKIVTYSISPSSIHITPVIEFNKKPDDILPYSGVWHDVKIKAYAAVTQAKESTKARESTTYCVELPPPEIEYAFGDNTTYTTGHFYDPDGKDVTETAATTEGSNAITDPTQIATKEGMYVLEAQSDFTDLQGKLTDRGEFAGSENDPIDLYEKSGNESANCYMVDQPGYYKFPVVYGNTYKNGALNNSGITITDANTKNGMAYYPNYKGNKIEDYNIAEGTNAVLAWQDAPDLIDQVKFIPGTPSWVSFRVRKHSITQGNALIVVRDARNTIVWSWHIWVSQHTKAWMVNHNDCQTVKSIYGTNSPNFKFTGKEYELTSVNLGYCDPHNGNPERKFKIKFKVTVNPNSTIEVTKYKYISTDRTETIYDSDKFTLTQAEFKGSLAGDNTYYQWGRNAPTPGGIYNKNTPTYYYKGNDYTELNMENKPLFNVYEEGEVSYNLRRTSSSQSLANICDEEKGVTVDWAIQRPYVFIMSQYDTDTQGGPASQKYRDHWHKFLTDSNKPGYAVSSTSKLFQMWNPKATKIVENMNVVEENVAKSVYDPCPAGYLVPPANLFSAFAYCTKYDNCNLYNKVAILGNYTTSITKLSEDGMKWTMTIDGKNFEFPATGVRNKSLRYKDFSGVTSYTISTRADESYPDPQNLRDKTYPSFRILTYFSSSTMGQNEQVPVFYIDNRKYTNSQGSRATRKDQTCMTIFSDAPGIGCYQPSADSYGLTVRPMREKDSY